MRPTLSVIVAAGLDGAIGRAGGMIWRLRGDLKRFKELTMGSPVVMGRLTFESLPKGALPGRRNMVVTRNGDFRAPGVETFPSLEDALSAISGGRAFILGGGSVYRQAMPLADELYLTLVEGECADADTRFDLPGDDWEETSRSGRVEEPGAPPYTFIDYRRKRQ